MTRQIRILDLRDSPWVDGPGRTVLQTAELLDRKRFSVVVGGFCNGTMQESEYLSDAERRSLEVQPIYESRALDYRIVGQIMSALDRHRIDIVHAHDFRSNLVGLYCARRKGIPIVATCHGWIANDLKGHLKKRLDVRLLSRFDRVVAVSQRIKDQLSKGGINSHRVKLIVNALVVEDFQPDASDKEFRHRIGLADETPLSVNVGRLSAEKGQDLLLRALAEVRRSVSDIFLVFVGIGPEEQALRSSAEMLGLSDVVRFAGYCSDMQAVYNSADLVVQSSLTEGMPNVILESLLMQTPVIATSVGGTTEIVEHGKNGYLVEPNSVGMLADGILDFLRNETIHNELALRGCKHVKEHFNHVARVRRTAELYSSIVDGG